MTLSVILPNYNHAHFLDAALSAIFSQTKCPDEVLIIDDASTDDSLKVINDWMQKHSEIKLLQNKINQGPIESVNLGIKKASSEFLAFCSADDKTLPNFFEMGVNFLQKHPYIGLCTGKNSHFHENAPDTFIPLQTPFGNTPKMFTKETIAKVFKKTTFFIHTNCTIYRRKHVLEMDGHLPKLKSISDWYMTVEIALKHGVGVIPEVFGAFRICENSYSNSLKSSRHQDEMFHALMKELKKKNLEKVFKSSGLLAHVGISLVLFVAKHSEYRSFFLKAFAKKCHFHLKKLIQRKLSRKVAT